MNREKIIWPVAILAGGLGTRLHGLTTKTPKSLIKVGGDYFINHQLRYLAQQHVRKVLLCVGHFGEQILKEVGDGSALGLEIHYSFDGPTLLGTGGAIKQALPQLGEAFFVLYGDSYLPINYSEVADFYRKCSKPALITILKNDNFWDKSNVLCKKEGLIIYDKKNPSSEMKHIDYGLSILSANILANYPEKVFDLADFFHELSLGKALAGYEVFERFYEIGSLSGLCDTNLLLNPKKDSNSAI